MTHIGAPLVGDQTYGRYRGLKAHGSGPAFELAEQTAKDFRRQALHATLLGFEHPVR
jgi:23S rRNA pseudouridine1911/1915/1917 synthase